MLAKYQIGILALQGDYEAHGRALTFNLGKEVADPTYIRSATELRNLDALIIPGGESSAMLKLLKEEFIEGILKLHAEDKPIYGTCAGAILLASSVENPEQSSLGLIDIDIKRNAYGRQLDSFITSALNPNKSSHHFAKLSLDAEAVFIRAPKITRIGKNVEILYSFNDTPVLVKEKNILISTFHPELSIGPHPIYQILLEMLK